MKKIGVLFAALLISTSAMAQKKPLPYKNPELPSEVRVQDLLSRMTTEEKIGQLLCPMGWEMYERNGDRISCSEKFRQIVKDQHVGMLWGVYRADPWTRKTLSNGLNPQFAAEAGNALQRYVMENTRLGIPLFLAEEAPHGHMAIGATVFPTGIAQASTWNPELLEEMGATISKEIRLQGGHISYGPVIDISRDPRWSRVEESFGEDYVLSARMAAAIAKGNGGGELQRPYSTVTTLKHFIAYGIPEGGHNGNSAIVGKRELHEIFLPPFKEAIDAGALSVMTAYNSIDGVPCTSNKELLTDILHRDWGFKGFTVSDLISIDGLKDNHSVAETLEDAGALAINAGVDADLGANAFAMLKEAVTNGKVDMQTIDTAVSRILKLKFDMGLFEHPYADPKQAKQHVRSREHIALARRVAQESIILLKNKGGILPLSRNIHAAVIGPNAHNRYNMLGDYTAPQEEENVKTVLDGVLSKLKPSQVEYVKGCAIRDTAQTEIDKAVEAAQRADVAIVVVGGSSARDFKTDYLATGAAIASSQTVSDMESGEGFDRATLNLLGKQQDLLDAVKATGKPMVVIYIQGRPLNMNRASEQADALLTAWYPGQEGGNAIADVLFGDYNPAGRLPVSVPRHEGQIPVYYNKKRPKGHNYIEMSSDPLYAFGHGLSYTTFDYSNLQVVRKGDAFEASFTLQNTGARPGDEVVQLYIRDEVASVVQPLMQLKQFKRIHLAPNEKRTMTFTLTADDLSILDDKFRKVVEPGKFTLMIGSSSWEIKLEASLLFTDSEPVGNSYPIVPYPNEITPQSGTFSLSAGTKIILPQNADKELRRVAEQFAKQFSKASGISLPIEQAATEADYKHAVIFRLNDRLEKEAYQLSVTRHQVIVEAAGAQGAFYAMQTIKQLLPTTIYGKPKGSVRWEMPCVEIKDAPRFGYRGMHLDVARHFFDVKEVKRYIDILAMHKVNTFHWHLTDDQGWRIEIKKYPKLTTIGSRRTGTVIRKEWGHYDNIPYGGSFTQEEIREVVDYAARQFITVIPEIDLPGHMVAALASYPQLGCLGKDYEVFRDWGVSKEVLCVGKESTFTFIENVLTEVMELFPSKYIHIGGDECPKDRWKKCPHCQRKIKESGLKSDDKFSAEHYLQSYAMTRVEKFLNDHGRQIIGWDEILEGGIAPNATIMSWRGTEGAIEAARQHHDAIMPPTSYCYFDYYQSKDTANEPFAFGGYIPVEKVYAFEPIPAGLTPEEQKHIIGVQANMWTEYITNGDHLEYMLLPRLAALSEVQWTLPAQKNQGRFLRNLKHLFDIYDAKGYNYARHLKDSTSTK